MGFSLTNRHGPCRAAGDSPTAALGGVTPAMRAAQAGGAQPSRQTSLSGDTATGAPDAVQAAGAAAQASATTEAGAQLTAQDVAAEETTLKENAAQPATQADAPSPEPAAQASPPQGDALTKALLKAVEERVARAEKSVVRSMAVQNGMEEAELAELLSQARSMDEGELPPKAQHQLDRLKTRWRERLLMAEVKTAGAELGLLDAEVALKLMDPATVTVAEDGAVSGVREALAALKQSKAYLFGHAGRGAWAQKLGSGSIPPLSGVEEAFYRKNPVLRK